MKQTCLSFSKGWCWKSWSKNETTVPHVWRLAKTHIKKKTRDAVGPSGGFDSLNLASFHFIKEKKRKEGEGEGERREREGQIDRERAR